jgi:hypothetical protein
MSLKRDIKLRNAQLKLRDTRKNYRQLMDEHKGLLREHDALMQIRKSVKTHKIKRGRKGKRTRAVAFAIASDWHVEEQVRPNTINGINKYNLEIAKARADYFFERVVRMVEKEQQDAQIETLVLALLGDFMSGNIHQELLENCLLRPIEAAIFAEELLASGIQFILDNTKLNLVVPCCVGNHTRITQKVHYSTELGNSLELMIYSHLRDRFGGDRVNFIIGTGYHVYMDVYGKVVRLHHGHAVRYGGGIGGLTIPLNKAIHQWNLTKHADLDIQGHYHQSMFMRRFVVNGSLIGYNAFALRIKAEYEPPSQSFFLMDEKRGKTVQTPIIMNGHH